MAKYDFKKVETKWQKRWLTDKAFAARDDSPKPKFYQLETFPYPSAAGLHVGHPKGYIAEDIHARFMRMHGKEVLYTMGWDAFGLPTENYAVKIGRDPQEVATESIANFRRQVQMFGLSYDWDREINTSDPSYYKWTQWLFIELYKKGLAYRATAKVNWCPKDQTVLANEQVVNGRCERDGELVVQKEMEQWFFKITEYKDRLIDDLAGLDWPEATMKRQEDWIGRSEGALIKFPISDPSVIPTREESHPYIEVFTTRADTIFSGTFLVLAPEHPMIKDLESQISNLQEVKTYIEETRHKTELMRQEQERDKTGVELKGVKAINPATQEEIPVWIADFVLGGYGTGAVFGDAHDERDFEFAKKFGIPLKVSLRPKSDELWQKISILEIPLTEEGILVNSGQFDGMTSAEARPKIVAWLKEKGLASPKTQYRLRDWSVSRQRYWGVPIPIIECDKCGMQPVPEKDLPVILPKDVDFRPKGIPPLASSESFMNVACPKCGGQARRVPETLDTFVDSSWYYLRYTDPKNEEKIFDKEKMEAWMPVQLYVIGAEHTVLHLLYSRFITKFLFDAGYVSFKEPFLKLRHQGLIRGADGAKMSKSKGNVVNPDELIGEFGADVVRIYEMFMGPFEDGAPWDPQGILGAERFLARFFRYVSEAKTAEVPLRPIVQKTIKKIEEDIRAFKFNTAISTLMILINELMEDGGAIAAADLESVIKLIHPFAPHMGQELWSIKGHDTFLDFEPWPVYDPALLRDMTFTLVVQINSKVRAQIEVPAGTTAEEAYEIAIAEPKIKEALIGKESKNKIYVPGRILNIVV